MVRVPLCFWAIAGGDEAKASKNGPAGANPIRFRFIPSASCSVRRVQNPPLRLAGPFAELSCRMERQQIIPYRKRGTGAVSTFDRSAAGPPGRNRLIVEPDVFHAPTVDDAVGRDGQPIDLRLPTGRAAPIEDDRPGPVFGHFPLDFPDQVFALLGVGFG